jgi:hypothetical protein
MTPTHTAPLAASPSPLVAHLLDTRERELTEAAVLRPEIQHYAALLWLASRRREFDDRIAIACEDVQHTRAQVRIAADRPAARVRFVDALVRLGALLEESGLLVTP